MSPVIVAKNLHKCYAGFAPVLKGVDIEVATGEMVAIMGPSGCGKSTMLHILGMLHAPDSGSLEILGTNVLELNREQTAEFRRRNMGFVMQASNLFDHSTVFENVEFPLIYDNVPPQERWERVIRALQLVRLSNRVHYRSNRLSGGEQQRVAIARAMVNNPRILLADEPTGALDAKTSRLIMENFRTLCHSGGVSMVMVTHDPKMADYCDSIYTLEDGVLICKKHEVSTFTATGNENFLKPPEPLVRGAIIAASFSRSAESASSLATLLHNDDLLSRIYALAHGDLFSGNAGYSLPLAIRRIGFLERWRAMIALAAGGSKNLRKLWKELPAPFGHKFWEHFKSLANAKILSRWMEDDEIQFLYAAGAGPEATAAWAASRLAGAPFAIFIKASDLENFAADWILKAHDAAFVVCPSVSVLKAIEELLPLLPKDKILLLRDPLPPLAETDGGESAPPRQNGQPGLMAFPAQMSKKSLKMFLDACVLLQKKKIAFRLCLAALPDWKLRWLVARRGLRQIVTYADLSEPDRIEGIYRSAEVFFVAPARRDDLDLSPALAEAMAFGLGIVCSGMSKGMTEVLKPDVNCLEVGAADAAAIAAALEKLLNDRNLRQKLGGSAQKDIRQLADEAGAKNLVDRIVAASADPRKHMDQPGS